MTLYVIWRRYFDTFTFCMFTLCAATLCSNTPCSLNISNLNALFFIYFKPKIPVLYIFQTWSPCSASLWLKTCLTIGRRRRRQTYIWQYNVPYNLSKVGSYTISCYSPFSVSFLHIIYVELSCICKYCTYTVSKDKKSLNCRVNLYE